MATANPTSVIVTRRKKRDLETTMKSLKKLLEPSRGSRKKNKPRPLPKKIIHTSKTINRFESFENSSEDGDYYPDKMKRKCNTKKIVLKPRHELKVVFASNKRKRGTPHRGLVREKPTGLTQTDDHRNFQTPLSVQTSMSNITKYELISPPHRSLTELTIDDLMRMDEDSLSEEDLMEVLTCPSPVWWEDPPEDFKEGVLYIIQTADSEDADGQHRVGDRTSIIDPVDKGAGLKRTGPICEAKTARKIAKLENILGNIKSRVQNSLKNNEVIDNIYVTNEAKPINERSNESSKINGGLQVTNERNRDKIDKNNDCDALKDRDSPDGSDNSKRRNISSSCSEISINEEDLLMNLEAIDIPIRILEENNDKCNTVENNNETEDNYVKHNDIPLHCHKDVKELKAISTDVADKLEMDCKVKPKVPTKQNKLKSVKPNMRPHICNIEAEELKHKDILKRLKQIDDILDVRLIQTPTNLSNEVKIWSKLDNFKRHNFKPEDFNEVIDVDSDQQVFCTESNTEKDPLRSETICIDDDDEVREVLNDDNEVREVINLDDIEKHETDNISSEMAEVVSVATEKDIITEDTIKISKDLDVRLVETRGPDKTNTIQKKTAAKEMNVTKVDDNIEGIRILPVILKPKVTNTTTNKQVRTKTTNVIKQYTNKKDKSKNPKANGIGIHTKNNVKILRINDLDISIVESNERSPESKKQYEIKNDLSITLVTGHNKSDKCSKNSEVNEKTEVQKVPRILPTLIKNPNAFESPKSIKSMTSETTDISEGTISDTNIKFLDDYEDDRLANVDDSVVDKDSKSKTTDVTAHLDKIYENLDNTTKLVDTKSESKMTDFGEKCLKNVVRNKERFIKEKAVNSADSNATQCDDDDK